MWTKLNIWIRKHVAALVLLDVLFGGAVFAGQGVQINTLTHQQAQLSSQQTQLSKAQAGAKCWDKVLDQAVKRPPNDQTSKAHLMAEARACAKITD